MSRGLVSFIAGLGTGYLQQSKYQDEQDRLKRLDQMAQESHDVTMQEAKQKLADKQALRDAAATVNVTPGAEVTGLSTGPTQYDDANLASADVRQAKTMADDTGSDAPATTVTPKFAAGGINYGTQDQAQAAATTANAPAARAQRMQTAMEQTGDYAGAANLRLADIKNAEAKQQLANGMWKHDLGIAMTAGHDGLAQLVSQSEAGPMAGKTIKAVPSADGKMVTYNIVDPDGTMKATNLSFTNDPQGVTQAAYMLDRTVSPEHRLEYALKSGKNAAEIQELTSKAGYWGANATKQSALAANGGSAKKADHFDEKEWDTAGKIDKDTVSLPDPLGGEKPVQSGDLRAAYMQVFNAARASGDMAPNEAAEHATTTVVRLKNAAQARVDQAKAADPKSPLTTAQAVRDIIKEAAAAKPPAAAPASSGGPGTKINRAEQATRDTDAAQILQTEFKNAQARLASLPPDVDADTRRRAQADVDGLTKEMTRRKVNMPAAVGVSAPAAPASVPAKVVASVGVPAPAAAPAPAPAAAAPDAGAALDAARQAYTAAVAKMYSYGARQRAADPNGFAQAQSAVTAAKQARDQAEAAWSRTVGTVPAAFPVPRM